MSARRTLFGCVACLVSMASITGLSACAFGSATIDVTTAPAAPPTTRSAAYHICSPIELPPPAGMVLTDRSLPNIGDGVLGRSATFDGGTRRLELFVGVDLLDAYEDLDFDSQPVDLGDERATLSTAGAFGTSDRLAIVTWTDEDWDDRCDELSVVGTNLTQDEVVEIARRIAAG